MNKNWKLKEKLHILKNNLKILLTDVTRSNPKVKIHPPNIRSSLKSKVFFLIFGAGQNFIPFAPFFLAKVFLKVLLFFFQFL